jgi:plasmid stability protein
MGVITIRGLDDAVVARLKARAKAAGRSMEEEVRRILISEAGPAKLSGEAAVEYFTRRMRENFGDRVLPDSTPLIREMREEDPTVSPPDADYP